MWAIMASPLLISSDIRNISTMNLQTYTNKYVIDVNQDKAGIQGIRIQGEDLVIDNKIDTNSTNIWSRELIDGSRIMLFLNVGTSAKNMSCDAQCFNDAGFYYGVNVKIYDLWSENQLITTMSTQDILLVNNVEPNGGVVMYKMVPYFDQYPKKQEI